MTPDTPQIFREVLALIMNLRMEEAECVLASMGPQMGQVNRRIRGHYQALVNFHRGDVAGAVSLMTNTIRDYGENANLVRDLAVGHFHLNNMAAFRQVISRLELILVEQERFLSSRTLFECELMIGKFMEEDARLAPASYFYDKAIGRATTGHERLKVLIQKARWHATYEPRVELSGYYRELIGFDCADLTTDQRLELEHALMVVELRLIGADHAWRRVCDQFAPAGDLDRRLFLFDFIDGALGLDLDIPQQARDLVGELSELSPYEVGLKLLLEQPAALSEIDTGKLPSASGMSWSSYLRLLCLAANREARPAARDELNRKIQLIVNDLDPVSQAHWNRRLTTAPQKPEISVKLSLRSRSVQVHGRIVDLAKKKIGFQLLAGLQQRDRMSVEQAIRLLWNAEFSPEHYHRLRMGAHRLNHLFNEISRLGKIIEVDSQTVQLRPEIRLICADSNPI